MKLDVVELFAGVGGFRVGLNKIKNFNNKTGKAIENGKWNFVWANQWEPSTNRQPAYDCYIKRFGKENVSNLDINKVNKNDIPNHSLLVGGFPCQDYSVARSTSNELGIKGKKGVLWWDIAEILMKKQPPFVLLENVDRLLKSPANQRGRDFAVMLKTFEEFGYIVQWRVINAAEYGMPQRRRRVFIFASHINTIYTKNIYSMNSHEDYLKNDGFFNDIFPININNIKVEKKNLAKYSDNVNISNKYDQGKFLNSGIYIHNKIINFDFIEESNKPIYTLQNVIDEAKQANYNTKNYIIHGDDLKKWKELKDSKKIPRIKPNGEEYFYSEGKMSFPDSLDLPARTMLTSEATTNRSSHVIKDEKTKKYRKITEVEAELIQMFPLDWTNTGMTSRQRYFMMGNALVTGVVEIIGDKIKNIIENE